MESIPIYLVHSEEDNQQGWVSQLADHLQHMLALRLDAAIDIALTTPANANVIVKSDPSAVLVVLCSSHLSLVANKIPGTTGIPHRFKILVEYVTPALQPAVIQGCYPYRFYISDLVTSELIRAKADDAQEGKRLYWLSLTQLVDDIYGSLKPSSKQKNKQVAIYLGEATPDVFYEHALLKRELQLYGYEIYPKTDLPASKEQMEVAMLEDLQHCSMSIHLVGQD